MATVALNPHWKPHLNSGVRKWVPVLSFIDRAPILPFHKLVSIEDNDPFWLILEPFLMSLVLLFLAAGSLGLPLNTLTT